MVDVAVRLGESPTLGWLRGMADDILGAVEAHQGTGRVMVFGSVARGDATEGSDVDLLVQFRPGASLLDLAALEMELRELLSRPVDVMSMASTGWAADRARLEAIPLT